MTAILMGLTQWSFFIILGLIVIVMLTALIMEKREQRPKRRQANWEAYYRELDHKASSDRRP
jgi:F0F1-type ATP synthase membrane subunit a